MFRVTVNLRNGHRQTETFVKEDWAREFAINVWTNPEVTRVVVKRNGVEYIYLSRH